MPREDIQKAANAHYASRFDDETTADRLRRGREFAAQRRRNAEDAQLADFRAWLGLERECYDATQRARAAHGPRSTEAHNAEREWMNALQLNPGLPPDSAFQRERGDCTSPHIV